MCKHNQRLHQIYNYTYDQIKMHLSKWKHVNGNISISYGISGENDF